MANPSSLVSKPFTTENQPANRGRKKGVPNRATVYERLLKMKTKIKAPDGTDQTVTLYEAIALGQAKSAMKGNTAAWKEIQDTVHGKILDKIEHSNPDGSALAQPIADALNQFERTLLKVYDHDGSTPED